MQDQNQYFNLKEENKESNMTNEEQNVNEEAEELTVIDNTSATKCACEFFRQCSKTYWLQAVENWIDIDVKDTSTTENKEEDSLWTKPCETCGQSCLLACFLSKECASDTSYVLKLFDSLSKEQLLQFANTPIPSSSSSSEEKVMMLPIRYAMEHCYSQTLIERLWDIYPDAVKEFIVSSADDKGDLGDVTTTKRNEDDNLSPLVVPLYAFAMLNGYSESFVLKLLNETPIEDVYPLSITGNKITDNDNDSVEPEDDYNISDYVYNKRAIPSTMSFHPFVHAIESKYQAVVEILIDIYPGISKTVEEHYKYNIGYRGNAALIRAIEYKFDSAIILKILNDCGHEVVGVPTLDGAYPLHFALHHFQNRDDHNQVILALLKAHPAAATAKNPVYFSSDDLPLHMAMRNKSIHRLSISEDVLIALLDANPDAANGYCLSGVSLEDYQDFRIAFQLNYPLCVAVLFQNSETCYSRTFIEKLIQACETGLLESINMKDGPLLLSEALGKQVDVDVLTLIFDAYPDVAKMTDHKGRYPLTVALKHQAPSEIILKLLHTYPDALWLSERTQRYASKGMIALHETIRLGCYDACLVYEMASAYPAALWKRDKHNNGKTPLQIAIDRQFPTDIIMALLKVEEEANANNSKGSVAASDDENCQASIRYTRDKTKDMPLHRAIHKGCDTSVLIKLLTMYPYAAMMKNRVGRLPLHVVAAKGQRNCTVEFVKQLIALYPMALEEKGRGGNVPRDLVQSMLPSATIELICKTRVTIMHSSPSCGSGVVASASVSTATATTNVLDCTVVRNSNVEKCDNNRSSSFQNASIVSSRDGEAPIIKGQSSIDTSTAAAATTSCVVVENEKVLSEDNDSIDDDHDKMASTGKLPAISPISNTEDEHGGGSSNNNKKPTIVNDYDNSMKGAIVAVDENSSIAIEEVCRDSSSGSSSTVTGAEEKKNDRISISDEEVDAEEKRNNRVSISDEGVDVEEKKNDRVSISDEEVDAEEKKNVRVSISDEEDCGSSCEWDIVEEDEF